MRTGPVPLDHAAYAIFGSGAGAGSVAALPKFPEGVIEMPYLATDSAASVGEPDASFRDSIPKRAYLEAGLGPDDWELTPASLELDSSCGSGSGCRSPGVSSNRRRGRSGSKRRWPAQALAWCSNCRPAAKPRDRTRRKSRAHVDR